MSQAQLADWGVGISHAYARGNVANALQFNGDPRSLIENATGGSGNDMIVGNQIRNELTGAAGNDRLAGDAGSDTLSGRDGSDALLGGLGRDTVLGGSGNDVFIFEAVQDSRVSAPRSDGKKVMPDIIQDFASGEDKIDLSAIDAIVASGGNDQFSFIGAASFSGASGELRCENFGDGLHLLGDVNGDRIADLHIIVAAPSIQLADIIL